MEEFITRDPMKPIMDFITTCPFLGAYHIDLTPTSTQKLVTSKPDGSSLDYDGSELIEDRRDMLGNRRCKRQATYQLFLLRNAGHNVQRKEIADFLFNLEQWVEHQQAHGKCPKLSNNKQDQECETMRAGNGTYLQEWSDGTQANLYVVQLTIEYFNRYKEDN